MQQSSNLANDGVITGCSRSQEWLLCWWWLNYRINNNHPVTFFDFGDMSHEAQEWCKQRGSLIKLNSSLEKYIIPKEKIENEEAKKLWESHLDLNVWMARTEWFKKPFVCLESPYERSVWIDLDCQVIGSINPYFQYSENYVELSLCVEPAGILELHAAQGLIKHDEVEYNSGVIVFKRNAKILKEWATICLERNNLFRGDQEALARLTHEKKILVPCMPAEYNWRWHIPSPPIELPVIVHWLGVGKQQIKNQIILFKQMYKIDLSTL